MKKSNWNKTMVVGLAMGFGFNADLGAVPLTLHRTGEGLSQGQLDSFWTVTPPGGTALAATSALDPSPPPGGWVTPILGGTWISVVPTGPVDLGTYEYSTTFIIGPDLDPSTAQISGDWYADEPNGANGIWLNGLSVSTFQGAIWNEPNAANAAFSINSGFVSGPNTLTFRVTNTGGPGGTLVQNLSGSANSVPDGTIFLAEPLLCAIAFFGIRRKLRRDADRQ